MIAQILFEFQKIFQKKNFIFFLSMICVLNIAIFVYDQQSNPTFPSSSYVQLQTKLNDIPNNQRYEYIKNEYEKYHAFEVIETIQKLEKNKSQNQGLIDSLLNDNPDIKTKYQSLYQKNHQTYYTNSLESEENFLKEIYDEFAVLHQYSGYLQDIQEKVETISHISIFQNNNDFSSKNIQKTAKDYQNLFHTELTYESEKGINDALSFPVTNLLMMIAMFVLASSMIIDEKENKLFSIMKITPHGQWELMLAKTIVMIIMIGFLTLIMTLSQLVYMHLTIGLGDLSRTIQSLASYNHCPFSLNVWQFLCIFFLTKWIATSFVGLLMMWLTIIMNHKVTALLFIALMIGVEFILYVVIPPLHTLYLFKYLNLISFLQIDSLFQIYRNVSFFNNPLSLQWLMIIVLLVGFLISVGLCVLTYQYKKNMLITPFEWPFHWKHQKISLSLFHQELYKTFYLQKVLVLCFVCIGMQIYQYQNITIYRDRETIVYMDYMKFLEGKLTPEKEKWIEQESQRYEALHEQEDSITRRKENKEITGKQADALLDKVSQELANENVFSQILNQYQRVKENSKCEFVVPFAYQSLFLQNTWTFMPTILLCIFLLLGLSQMFPYEYQNQMQRMSLATVKGHKQLIYYKIIVSIIICLIFLLITTIPILILFQQAYGFSSLSASIVSIEQFSLLPSWLSIGMTCLFSLLIKLFAIVCMVFIMHAIALKTRNYTLTCFISMLVFLVPLLLAYGNVHILDSISLYPLLMNGLYVEELSQMIQLLCSFAGYLILMVCSIKYIYKYYKV